MKNMFFNISTFFFNKIDLKIGAIFGILFLHVPLFFIILYAFTTEDKSYQFPPPGYTLKWFSIVLGREDIWNAVQAGCKGYLTKRAGEIEDVLQAIKEVASGNTYFPAKIASKIESRSSHQNLTPRELEVLQGLANGFSNKGIMEQLDLSEGTVKLHLSNLRRKLDASDRTQALINGVKRGLVKISQAD